ncbi:hypothetical protein [uncultured Photobacterium sp.]|uniref:hypothetical protein n=1 Tax=uncultured Photobacterium sp. TaxID=173973 RepID=UPI002632927F|nr:hypothetical protein [uncultured Photobacterium sp.]
MNFFERKEIKLISQLNMLTSNGQLNWEICDVPLTISRSTDDFIPLMFTTYFDNKRFLLFQRRFQSFADEYERFYWNEHISIAIVDDYDRVLWEFYERESSLYDLFQTVREKAAGLDDLFSKL